MKVSAQFGIKHTLVCVLDFVWSFATCFTLSQTLGFALRFPGEFACVFHAGLATQGSPNFTNFSPYGAVATISYSFHDKFVLFLTRRFYFLSSCAIQINNEVN